MLIREWNRYTQSDDFSKKLRELYGDDAQTLALQRERYDNAVEAFARLFPTREEIHVFSASGRTEIGGNHTDHQRGCALAAAIDPDAVAVVAFHEDGVIRLYSEGYGMTHTELDDLSVREEEKGKSSALIRGVCARFAQRGTEIGCFDAYVTSDVLSGSGLSSSAAFEVLIATILDDRQGGATDAVEIAKIGRFAENEYFGKNSGLLDQLACAVGGMAAIDFCDSEHPAVDKIGFDFEKAGYRLCITDTKGSHSDLTDEYAAVPSEMGAVAACFGKTVLREVDEREFDDAIPTLRGKCPDRAILRAMHFFGESRRAADQAEALKAGDVQRFLALYRQSAQSSELLLQNIYSAKDPLRQDITLGLAVSRTVLGDEGAARVHGGGFAGTIQAFVPTVKTDEYISRMDALFGEGSCRALRIRPVGAVKMA